MADDKAGKQDGEELVMVTNVSRRPVLAQAPGGAVRLGPGERRKLPKSLAGTAEIRRLCDRQVLVVSPIEAQPATEAPAAQPRTEPAAPQEPKAAGEESPGSAPAKPQAGGSRNKRSTS